MSTAPLGLTSCPKPFFDESVYPLSGGHINGRFCGNFTQTLSCCLPCPLEAWVYSDELPNTMRVTTWFNFPPLVLQVFLLLTYLIFPVEESHRHALSIGLVISLIFLELSFVIPLGTSPDQCYNEITPNDMYSSLSCAWTGALIELGSTASVVWVLLRSLWTHTRICWNRQPSKACLCIMYAIGWGLPGIFLSISLPITGVSYRFGKTCLPNPQHGILTWFGWLIGFGCLATAVQCCTTSFCLWIYIRNLFGSRGATQNPTGTSAPAGGAGNLSLALTSLPIYQSPLAVRLNKQFAWRRVKETMSMQWRSIALSFVVIVFIVYFCGTDIWESKLAHSGTMGRENHDLIQIREWTTCLIISGGNKTQCLPYADALRVSESSVVANFSIAALVGWFTFVFMFRTSMLSSWRDKLLSLPLWKTLEAWRDCMRNTVIRYCHWRRTKRGPKTATVSAPLPPLSSLSHSLSSPNVGEMQNGSRSLSENDILQKNGDHENGEKVGKTSPGISTPATTGTPTAIITISPGYNEAAFP